MSKDANWFKDEEWQKGERKADKDLEEGRYKDFSSVKELLEYLHHERARKKNEETK